MPYEVGQIVASELGAVRVTNVFDRAIVGQILEGAFAGKWATLDTYTTEPEVIGREQ